MAASRTRKRTMLLAPKKSAGKAGLDGSSIRRKSPSEFILESDGSARRVGRLDAQLWADANLPPADYVDLFYPDRLPRRRHAYCGPGTTARLDAIACHEGTDMSHVVSDLVAAWIKENEGAIWWSYRHKDSDPAYYAVDHVAPVPSVSRTYAPALWEEVRFTVTPVMNDTCRRLGAGKGYGTGDVLDHMARQRCEELNLALDRTVTLRLM